MLMITLLQAAVLLSWSPPAVAQADTFVLKEWPSNGVVARATLR